MGRAPLDTSVTASQQDINIVREKPPPFRVKRWLYNSKEGTVCGRTGSSWGKQIECR